ncbi:MAG TPA: co-chaperone GroES, partial [Urbifossiella sp.]
MKIAPLNEKIVVERLEADDRTAGGIILPDTAKEKPKQGKIISVGDGKLLDDG